MKRIYILCDQVSGTYNDSDDYFLTLNQLPDCMYCIPERSLPVNLNNHPLS